MTDDERYIRLAEVWELEGTPEGSPEPSVAEKIMVRIENDFDQGIAPISGHPPREKGQPLRFERLLAHKSYGLDWLAAAPKTDNYYCEVWARPLGDYHDKNAWKGLVTTRSYWCKIRAEVVPSRAPESPEVIYRTGVQGRPTSWYLMETELRRRYAAGETYSTLAKWAYVLNNWLLSEHPKAPPIRGKTITNHLSKVVRELKAPSSLS